MFASNTLLYKYCLLHAAFAVHRLWETYCPCSFCPWPMVQDPISDPGAISCAAAGIFTFQHSDLFLAHNPGTWAIPVAGAVLALPGCLSPGWAGGIPWSQGASSVPFLKPMERNWAMWHPDYMLSRLKMLD